MDPFSIGAYALGAGIKAGGDIYGASQDYKAGRASARALSASERAAAQQEQASLQQVIDMYGPESEMGQQALQQLYAGTMDNSFIVDPGEFSYGKGVNDFLDPSIAYQQEQASNQLRESAAAGGGMLSGPALAALQKRSMQIGEQGWGTAYDRMTNDKASAYTMYQNDFAARRQQVQDRIAQLTNISNLGQTAKGNIANMTSQMGQRGADSTRQLGQVNAMSAQLPYAHNKAMVGAVTNAVGGGLGTYAGFRQNQDLMSRYSQPQDPMSYGGGVAASVNTPQMQVPLQGNTGAVGAVGNTGTVSAPVFGQDPTGRPGSNPISRRY